MSDKTDLEKQEEEVGVLYGNPKGLGAVDKSMLEISDTNRLVFDSRQSELQIALKLLHSALYAADNKKPERQKIKNESTGEWKTETVRVDNWKWLSELNRMVETNQLTIRGYSRSQHLRQAAALVGVAVEDEPESFWNRLFGR